MSLDRPLSGSLGKSVEAAGLRPLSLRSNFAWTLVGTGVYGLSQWGMLIALAKLGSPELVGRFALGLALCAPVVMLTNLQLRTVQATDARQEYSFGDYLSLRVITTTLALGLILTLTLLGGYRAETTLVILAVGAAKSVESFSDIIYGLWQRNERLDLIAVSMMLKGPASLAALWAVMRATGNLLWAALALALVWAAILLTYDLANARRSLRLQSWRSAPFRRARHRLPTLRRLVWLAAPLGVVGLLDSLGFNLPRYFLQHTLGEAALGHFAALAYLMVAGNMVAMALSQSAAPLLAKRYVEDVVLFKRLIWGLLRFGLALGVGGVLVTALFGRPLLSLLYRSEYAAHSEALVWIMIAAGIGYLARFLVCSMTAARYFRAQAPLYAASTLVCAAACHWLVPRYGLLGAAWATGATTLSLLLGAAAMNYFAVRRRERGGELPPVALTTPERPGE